MSDDFPKALSTTVTDALGRKVLRAVVWPPGHPTQIPGTPVILANKKAERDYDGTGIPAPATETPPQQEVSYLSGDWWRHGVSHSPRNK
jgi:hypothetical protein